MDFSEKLTVKPGAKTSKKKRETSEGIELYNQESLITKKKKKKEENIPTKICQGKIEFKKIISDGQETNITAEI